MKYFFIWLLNLKDSVAQINFQGNSFNLLIYFISYLTNVVHTYCIISSNSITTNSNILDKFHLFNFADFFFFVVFLMLSPVYAWCLIQAS